MHVPEGATPKDGPSAGVAMATSIVSVLTGIPVRRDVAMTGEITLRGRVLPIGGLKEKLLAALRAGITTVFIPKENEKDLAEIPDNVKKHLKLVPVVRCGRGDRPGAGAPAGCRSNGRSRRDAGGTASGESSRRLHCRIKGRLKGSRRSGSFRPPIAFRCIDAAENARLVSRPQSASSAPASRFCTIM